MAEDPQSFLLGANVQVGVAVAVLAVVSGAAYFCLVRKAKPLLDENKYRDFPIVKRRQLSHNVLEFQCALPTERAVLGLPVGRHIRIIGIDKEGVKVEKPYTPTTLDSDKGHFKLVVKIYPEGRMSYHLNTLKEGDSISAKGPAGRFSYKPNQYRALGMLAGGTGITPMFQVARAVLENPRDKTKVHLIYANVTYDDILLKDEIDSLAKTYPSNFSVHYVLNTPPEKWTGGVGYISRDMIEKHFPPPAKDVKVLRCGPPPMNKAMLDHLNALGHSKEMQFQF